MSRVTDFSPELPNDPKKQIAYLDRVTAIGAQGKATIYAVQEIANGSYVLDCGCGVGDDVRAISTLVGEHGSVVGIDPNEVMIATAIERGVPPNVGFLVGRAEAMPFPDAHFDAIRAERLFQHLREPDAAARELRRVLKPHGNVLLLDQDWQSIVVAGGERETTRKIVNAFADSLADGWAGRNQRAHLLGAGFTRVETQQFVTSLSFAHAYAFVLQDAVAAALARAMISGEEADAWVRGLLAADARGAFLYCVTVFLTVGRP